MKTKKTVGTVLLIAGIIIFLLGLYARSRVEEAKQNVKKTSGALPDNPVNQGIGSALEHKISSYDAPVLWTMIGGIVIGVVGVGTLCCACRKK